MALESLFFNSWRLWTYMWPEIAILYAGDFSVFEISKPSRFPFDDSKKKKNVVRSLYNVVQLWFILVDEVSKNESIHPCTICHSVYFHILPKAFLIYFNSSVDVHLLIEIKKEPRQQTTEQFEYNLWLPCVKSLGDHAKAIKVQFSPVNFLLADMGLGVHSTATCQWSNGVCVPPVPMPFQTAGSRWLARFWWQAKRLLVFLSSFMLMMTWDLAITEESTTRWTMPKMA